MAKKKMSLETRIASYEAFFNRTFDSQDVDKILEEGGGINFNKFKEATTANTKSADLQKAMFQNKRKDGTTSDKLGKNIFARFFEDENITVNVRGRIIVRTGQTLTFKGKLFKGGMFLPKLALAKRVY